MTATSSGAIPGSEKVQLAAWRTFSVTINRVIEESADVSTYELCFEDPLQAEAFRFLPGQFNMLYVPGVGEAAISIAGAGYQPNTLQHSVRRVGSVTGALARGGAGMQLGLRGPFGSHWPIESVLDNSYKPDVVIAAGGIGIAPLRSFVEYLVEKRSNVGKIYLLLGARSPGDLIYRNDWDRWKEHGVTLETIVDRGDMGWQGHVGVITLLLDQLQLQNPRDTLLLTCGPEVMMRYVANSGLEKQIPIENIWLTLERNMNCGFGMCGHCQLGPEFICKDGPVLAYGRVRRWLNVQEL